MHIFVHTEQSSVLDYVLDAYFVDAVVNLSLCFVCVQESLTVCVQRVSCVITDVIRNGTIKTTKSRIWALGGSLILSEALHTLKASCLRKCMYITVYYVRYLANAYIFSKISTQLIFCEADT